MPALSGFSRPWCRERIETIEMKRLVLLLSFCGSGILALGWQPDLNPSEELAYLDDDLTECDGIEASRGMMPSHRRAVREHAAILTPASRWSVRPSESVRSSLSF